MGVANASTITYAGHGTEAEGRTWIGRAIASDAPFVVEAGRVADFCALVEDGDGRWWGGGQAPPATLMVWRFASPWHPGGRPPHGPMIGVEVPLPADSLVNVSTESTFFAPIAVGDELTYVERVDSISERKQTALGPGYFVTTSCDVTNGSGRPVARDVNVLLRFERTAAPADPGSTAAPGADRSLPAGPALEVLIDDSLCALMAAATRDYFPGHYDDRFAAAQGISAAYPGTIYYQGLADRLACESTEGAAVVKQRVLRLQRAAPKGERLRAQVASTSIEPDGSWSVAVDLDDSQGPVARAQVRLALDGDVQEYTFT